VRKRLRCPDVQVVCADAAEFPVPDDMTYAYLYHPFEGRTLERVLSNIVESIDRRPRRVRLIYAHPESANAITATGRFRLDRRIKGGRGDDQLHQRVLIYVNQRI
jgi:hypothetical protein